MATLLSHCQTPDEVVDTGLAAACEALGAEAGAIWIVRAEGRVDLLAQRGFDDDGQRLVSDLPRYAPALARLITAGAPVRMHAEQLLFGVAADIWNVAARPCLMVVPLLSRGSVLGALCLAGSQEKSCSAMAADLTQAIGAELGVALENARRFESVKDLAEHDPLTGVLNRRAFFEQMQRELRHVERHADPLSLIILDLDGFKTINDTFGHSIGDRALRRVARLLVACARGSDTVARFGGDEFVILAPDTTAAGAVALAERIKRLVGHEDEEEEELCPPLRLSFGVATYPSDARDVQMLVERADANLYRSKQAGGHTVTSCVEAPDLTQRGIESYRPRRQARAETPARIVTPIDSERPHEVA
ncbi:MAG: GGDEF domain-containing protein [Chloroflexota bacterium]